MTRPKSQRPHWLGEDRRVWDHTRVHLALIRAPGIGAYEQAIYLGLAMHADVANGEAYPSIATLAGYAECSERRARTAIDTLAAAGWIAVVLTPGRASTYTLLPPPTLAPSAGVPDDGAAPGTAPPLHQVPDTPAPGADEQEPPDHNQGTTPPLELVGGTSLDPFDAFWMACPPNRRERKKDARTAWARATRRAAPATIIDGMTRYAASVAGREARFIAYPTTWLNGDRWEDSPAPAAGAGRPPGGRAVDTDRDRPGGLLGRADL